MISCDVIQWRRIRRKVLFEGKPIEMVAMQESLTVEATREMLTQRPRPKRDPGRRVSLFSTVIPYTGLARGDRELLQWAQWLYSLEQDELACPPFGVELSRHGAAARKRMLSVLATEEGFGLKAIAKHLAVSPNTVIRSRLLYEQGGVEALTHQKVRARMADADHYRDELFKLLHEPPSQSGFNRTSWRIADLQEAMAKRGFPTCRAVLREAIEKSGFRWRAARVVLTSTDPQYQEKLNKVQDVLSHLKANEGFFSIDEYGPFSVKAIPGRSLAAPGQRPTVPQWQKSRGRLIVTAALELSKNQVTHFYSTAKNTAEMVKLIERLLVDYAGKRTLYLSWDAASWHDSKQLKKFIDKHNDGSSGGPRLELVPLPASAQFLNVIESVFSGMSRAIIHNSNYGTLDEAKAAIDQYFSSRNEHFRKTPKRAGDWIWGKERTPSTFSSSNNCKDPAYR
ncbi:IS630 family transposase [Roseateles sp. LYH14W]|uniref:IS630 family transposase n=1 Tax=Pelomonas parva TaxID=3299032 RepID=A0ABW7F7Y4_9BURK